jgi:hypothetical protein
MPDTGWSKDRHVDSASDERTVNNDVRHQYRVLTEPEKKAMVAVKDAGAAFLETLDQFCHPGRETSLAKTKIEEAVMWAVKGITA